MNEFTSEEKERLFSLLEEIVFYLSIDKTDMVQSALSQALIDRQEQMVYEATDGYLSVRGIADSTGLSYKVVRNRPDRLRNNGLIRKDQNNRYEKTLTKQALVQRYSATVREI
jgi:hypothetical protein